jgi:hypothetical protein
MATTAELVKLKEKLIDKKMPEHDVNKILAYLSGAINAEQYKDKKPVTSNTIDMLYTLIFKWWNQGLLIDGVNVVITGKNMAMVTFHGYKNKVLQTYPETQFDIQLVREGDEFSVSKESGAVVYQHNIGDPFTDTEPVIKGAYVVFKNKRGEFIETLNRTDYLKMKKASGQKTWDDWASEFWLKSVIKRACKRHFYDVVEEIDKMDNEDFGLFASDHATEQPDVAEHVKKTIEHIKGAADLADLNKIFQVSGLGNNKQVVEAYKDRKLALMPKKELNLNRMQAEVDQHQVENLAEKVVDNENN